MAPDRRAPVNMGAERAIPRSLAPSKARAAAPYSASAKATLIESSEILQMEASAASRLPPPTPSFKTETLLWVADRLRRMSAVNRLEVPTPIGELFL